ncbi:MAG: carbonic anhydrase [Flavobacteriales bacterium]|nr:MAG: carbonic anhydrase [Flavobacteriales bacterium]PIE49367.1 MAG: carbonic anhydrase [Flavobacteriales bacterium]
MKNTIRLFTLLFVLVSLFSCKEKVEQTNAPAVTEPEVAEPVLVSKVLTSEDQSALSPDKVITAFKEGNERYMNNDLTPRDLPVQVKNSTGGQYPQAVILSCIDSRVPVEHVFDQGIGDVFVARVAGNVSDEDILGSMEYACKVAGSKLVLVMGHEHCGAVKAAIDNVKMGNITALLSKIRPAVLQQSDYDGEKTSKNKEFVAKVVEGNVENTINEIRKNSPILKEMEDNGEIKIVGAVYDLDTGKVDFR